MNIVKHRLRKSFAFTLAEVLIVLAVLGVVAAITIPDLVQDYQERATVTAVKKVYSVLNQAVDMAVAENGPVETWDWGTYYNAQSARNVFQEYLKPHLKISKDCGEGSGCWSGLRKWKDLQGQIYNSTAYAGWISLDGAVFGLNTFGSSCNTVRGTSNALKHTCGFIHVDINGKHEPNTLGKDAFEFWITSEGVVPAGTRYDYISSISKTCNINNSYNANGMGCTAWIIQKENMDYLKQTVSW